MRLRVVVALVALVTLGGCKDETQNVATPDYELFGNEMFLRIGGQFAEERRFLDTRLTEVEEAVLQTCDNTKLQGQITGPPPPPPNTGCPVGAVEQVTERVVEKVAEKVEEVEEQLQAVERRLVERDASLATAAGLTEMKAKLSTSFVIEIGNLKPLLQGLATESQVAQVAQAMESHMGEVRRLVTEVKEACGRRDHLTEVLQALNTVQLSVEQLSEERQQWEQSAVQLSRCCSQDTSGELRNLGSHVNGLQGLLEEVKESLGTRLDGLEQKVEEVLNQTEPQPTTTTTTSTTTTPMPTTTTSTTTTPMPTTTTKRPLGSCEDSVFLNTHSLNVCRVAIAYRKCQMDFVSYHCCRSCTAAGMLPLDGPWRYLDYPRQVTHFQVADLLDDFADKNF